MSDVVTLQDVQHEMMSISSPPTDPTLSEQVHSQAATVDKPLEEEPPLSIFLDTIQFESGFGVVKISSKIPAVTASVVSTRMFLVHAVTFLSATPGPTFANAQSYLFVFIKYLVNLLGVGLKGGSLYLVFLPEHIVYAFQIAAFFVSYHAMKIEDMDTYYKATGLTVTCFILMFLVLFNKRPSLQLCRRESRPGEPSKLVQYADLFYHVVMMVLIFISLIASGVCTHCKSSSSSDEITHLCKFHARSLHQGFDDDYASARASISTCSNVCDTDRKDACIGGDLCSPVYWGDCIPPPPEEGREHAQKLLPVNARDAAWANIAWLSCPRLCFPRGHGEHHGSYQEEQRSQADSTQLRAHEPGHVVELDGSHVRQGQPLMPSGRNACAPERASRLHIRWTSYVNLVSYP
eukprot:756760-Hanusia_phi.AAC.4